LRDYELVLVVSPEAGEEGFPSTVERVHQFIQDRGGAIKNVDQWGRRRLAYPLQRFTEGYYNITQFSLNPADVRALEGNLGLAEDVLRHLVVRLDEVQPEPPRRRAAPEAAVAEEPEAEAEGTPVSAGETVAETEAAVEPEAAETGEPEAEAAAEPEAVEPEAVAPAEPEAEAPEEAQEQD
jgi:small subunit ribosomal protein S6